MNILYIAHNNLKKNPRALRQIKSTYQNHKVYTVGASRSGYEKFFFQLKKHNFFVNVLRLLILRLGFHEWYYWDIFKKNIYKNLRNIDFDLVIAHEIRMLPIALKIARKTPVILDAHEYSPKNFDDDPIWRFFIKHHFIWLCNKFLRRVDNIITVSPGILSEYKKVFNLNPILLTNAAEFTKDLKPTIINNNNKIKLIHHGVVSKSRSLDLLIEMMKYLDNNKYELTLMLVCSTYQKLYMRKLIKKSRGLNVKFVKPVKSSQIIRFANKFDIGIHFVPPVSFNLKYGLGNKFFEFIQSRLAIAIGPDIEMSKYVKKYKLGIIAKDWSAKSLAGCISSCNLEMIMYYKSQCHKFSEILSSKNNINNFKKLVSSYDKN